MIITNLLLFGIFLALVQLARIAYTHAENYAKVETTRRARELQAEHNAKAKEMQR